MHSSSDRQAKDDKKSEQLGILGGGQLAMYLFFYNEHVIDLFRMMIMQSTSTKSTTNPAKHTLIDTSLTMHPALNQLSKISISILSERDSPASYYSQQIHPGSFKSSKDLESFTKGLDYLTIETEHVDTQKMTEVMMLNSGLMVYPSIDTIQLIQNKYNQKQFYEENKIKTPMFILVDLKKKDRTEIEIDKDNIELGMDKLEWDKDKVDLDKDKLEWDKDKVEFDKDKLEWDKVTTIKLMESIKKVGSRALFPVMVKSTLDSYDGKGNILVHQVNDLSKVLQEFQNKKVIVEEFVEFKYEASCICARDTFGESVVYEPTMTLQKDNCCILTFTSKRIIPQQVRKEMCFVATRIVERMKGVGVFGVEFFVTLNEQVLVNEVSCRPHNSGHWTIGSVMVDQFRQHVLCVTGKHIDKDIHITDDNVCICMINILGLSTLEAYEKQLERCVGVNGADIIMYEKVWRIGRKMGHMIVRGGTEYVVEVAKLITEIRDIELLQV